MSAFLLLAILLDRFAQLNMPRFIELTLQLLAAFLNIGWALNWPGTGIGFLVMLIELVWAISLAVKVPA